jgi:hypothetical protein
MNMDWCQNQVQNDDFFIKPSGFPANNHRFLIKKTGLNEDAAGAPHFFALHRVSSEEIMKNRRLSPAFSEAGVAVACPRYPLLPFAPT